MAPTKKSTRKKPPLRKKSAKKKVDTRKVSKKKVTKRAAPKAVNASSKKRASTIEDPRIDRLKILIKLLEKSTLGELSYADSDIRVSLRQGGTTFMSTDPIVSNTGATNVGASTVDGVANENTDDLHLICSPFVGTFYTAPSPDSEAYTGIGQTVSKGQTVCIVEAMKLMNEIEAEVGGIVVEVLAENAQGVQYGDPLFKIKVG